MTFFGDTHFVCNGCVEEDYLSKLIRREGDRRICAYCGRRRNGWPLERLAEAVHEVLDTNYIYSRPGAYEGFESAGNAVQDLISELIVADDCRIGSDIKDLLSARFAYSAVRDGDDDPYGDDVVYRQDYPDTEEYAASWAAFRDEIATRSRFFSPHARDMLDLMFRDLGALATEEGSSVISDWGPRNRSLIYRGRVATSESEVEKFLGDPGRELVAPPHLLARAGRMNGAGISVFYGALSIETCIAELRPPVGSYVVIAGFVPVRRLKLLDLDRLRRAAVDVSIFHPDYAARRGRATFLRRLSWELGRPVMPGSQELDYLPTQAVAEYLANLAEPRLDGIRFASSQTNDGSHNIALFHHASLARARKLPPGSKTQMLGPNYDEFGAPDEVVILEQVRRRRRRKPLQQDPLWDVLSPKPVAATEDLDPEGREPFLRLDKKSMIVAKIDGVSYDRSDFDVARYSGPRGNRLRIF